MTDTTRDLIQRMARALDLYRQMALDDYTSTHPFADEARTLLSQPEPEGPTEEEMEEAPFLYAPEWYNNEMAAAWEAGRNSGWRDAFARWGRPAVNPETNGQT